MAYALVSGGSRGIGYAIAMALAKRRYDLILTGRNKEDLQRAKARLENEFDITVDAIAADMLDEQSLLRVAAHCMAHTINLKILCNVAGLGGDKDYPAIPIQDSIRMLRLNTEPAIVLIHHLLPLLKKNRPAFILNVSSMAAFAPIPAKNIYSAAKSALLFFSISLQAQLKNEGVSVSCLCPGPVFTKPSIRQNTMEKLGWLGKQMAVDVEKLGEYAVRRLLRQQFLIIPGALARLMALLMRIAPLRFLARASK